MKAVLFILVILFISMISAQNIEVDYSEKFCPVCGGEIGEDSYVLEFGKSYLRKRAHFDGIDCLSYFVNSKRRFKSTFCFLYGNMCLFNAHFKFVKYGFNIH